MGSSDGTHELNFVVHWLNNKELHFTQEAERIIMELTKQPNTPTPEGDGASSGDIEDDGSGSQPDTSVVSESSDPADPAKSRSLISACDVQIAHDTVIQKAIES